MLWFDWHIERNCSSRGLNRDGEAQFGNWMRASYPRSPTKKYRNGRDFSKDEGEESQGQDRRSGSGLSSKMLLTYTAAFHQGEEGCL